MRPPLPEASLRQLFTEARSYNGYHVEPFTLVDAQAVYDLLKMGPTATNQHPARFVWCLSEAARAKLADCASEKNGDKIRAAPAAVIVAADDDFHEHLPYLFPHVDARPWFTNPAGRAISADRNSTLQGAYLIMAARALGFDTGPMSGFDHGKVDAAFFKDEPTVRSNFICTIGRGDPSSIFPRLPRPPFERFNRAA